MLDSDLAPSDRAAAAFPEAGAMRWFMPALAARDAVLFELLAQQAVGWVAWLVFNINRQLEDPTLPATWKDVLRGWVDSPQLQLDAASLRASLPTPSIVRTMARDYGRALLAWPQLWSFCRERFA